MNIRLYQSADRDIVHRICADTAFLGAPIEAIFGNRHLFNDYFAAAYTDYEQDHLWIAEAEGQTVGYLMGCPDTRRLEQTVNRRIMPRVLARLAAGRYRLDTVTRRFISRYLVGLLRNKLPHIDLTHYPAHLHINMAKEWRGRGLGKRLLSTYLNQLCAEGVPGVHLETTDHNTIAVPLYEKLGFRLLDRKASTLYQQAIAEPVHSLVYGLLLQA